MRERWEDIPLLADYFLKQYAAETKEAGLSFSSQAIETMGRYDWPGNVRELQHAIEQAVVLTTGHVIVPEDRLLSFPAEAAPGSRRAASALCLRL